MLVLVALIASISVPFAHASPQAESIVRLSPLGTIAEQSRAMIRAGIRDGLVATGQVDPLVAETIAGFGASAFDTRRIRARLVNDLDADLTGGELQAVEDWYGSGLGQRLAQSESDAALPAAWKAMAAEEAALREQYEGSRRQQLYDRYDRAVGANERAVETAIAVQLQLAEALAALSEGDTTQSVQDQVRAGRPMIEREIGEQTYLAYLYMYRSFSDQELETYTDFLESPAGQAFTDSASESIHAAIMEPVSTVGTQLVRLLGPGGE
ncbi:MAG: DUF2059 domain-containing protein [Pseudomonadota bacterium]